ncbi:MAG TPA: FG-GAP-like repeat-containing protein [Desulfomonilia bacterium]
MAYFSGGRSETSDNSRIYAQGRSDNTVLIWALSEIKDRAGNKITYTYGKNTDTGEYWPTRIDYRYLSSSNPTCSIIFDYEDRPDMIQRYLGGSADFMTKKLTHIKTYSGGRLINDYFLNYEQGFSTKRSRLKSITLYDGNNNYIPSTLFTWSDNNGGFQDEAQWKQGSIPSGDAHYADFDGDGKTDLLIRKYNSNELIVYKSNGNNYEAGVLWGTLDVVNNSTAEIFVGDFNGDGRKDIAQIYGTFKGAILVYLSNGNSFEPYQVWLPYGGIYSDSRSFIAADMNGDGRDDIVGTPSTSTSNDRDKFYVYISNGVAFNTYNWSTISYGIDYIKTGDFNGDKKIDFIGKGRGNGVWYTWLSNGNGFDRIEWPDSPFNNISLLKNILIGDMNGDNKDDVVEIGPNGDIYVRVSTCKGLLPKQRWGGGLTSIPFTSNNKTTYSSTAKIGDFNGDGRADIAENYSQGNLNVTLSNGTSFAPLTYWGRNTQWNMGDWVSVADFNGDGIDDCVTEANPAIGIDYDCVTVSRSGLPDYLLSITNGLDELIEIGYGLLSDSSIYTRITTSLYPIVDYEGPLAVVKNVFRSNGVGGTRTYSYTYSSAKMDIVRRRFQGFYEIRMRDYDRQIDTIYNYLQTFPFVGLVEKTQTVKSISGILLNSSEYIWEISVYKFGNSFDASYVPVNTLNSENYNLSSYSSIWNIAQTYFPYVKQSVQRLYALPPKSMLLKETTTVQSYTGMGNLLNKEVTATAISKDTLKKKYNYNYYPVRVIDLIWNTGLLKSEEITSEYTYMDPVTNEYKSIDPVTNMTLYEYFTDETPLDSDLNRPKYGKLKKIIIEPNESTTSSLKKITEYDYETKYGCIGSDKISGYGVSARETTYSYVYTDTTHTLETKNPLNHITKQKFDDGYGTIVSLIDPNNLETTFSNDGFGRKISEKRPDQTQTTYSYGFSSLENCAYFIKNESSGKPPITRHYDIFDRAIYTYSIGFNGEDIVMSSGYDAFGRKTVETRFHYIFGDPQATSYNEYDDYDRPGIITRYDSGTTSYTYNDEDGMTTTAVNQKGQKTRRAYNVFGSIAKVQQLDDSISTTYAYDPLGNLTEIKDKSGNVIKMVYDKLSRKTSMTDPDMGTWSYTYNPFGELVIQTDQKQQTITNGYDLLGRIKTREAIEIQGTDDTKPKCFASTAKSNLLSEVFGTTKTKETTTWIYDKTQTTLGLLSDINVTAPDKTYKETYQYDSYNRPTIVTKTIDEKEYVITTTYDSESRIQSITYPETSESTRFMVTYGYKNGYLEKVYDSTKEYWKANSLNALGQVTNVSLGNALTTEYIYDNSTGRLAEINTSGNVQKLSFTYDEIGNMKTRADASNPSKTLNETFEYDRLNRLRSSKISGVTDMTYDYYDNGNIMTKTDMGTYQYGSKPHAVSTIKKSGSELNYSYDDNGNMIEESEKKAGVSNSLRKLTYNAYNMPYKVTKGSDSATFTYGPMLELIKQEIVINANTTTTVYCSELFEKVSTGDVVDYKHYIQVAGESIAIHNIHRENSQSDVKNYYLHKDNLGSITCITNDLGQKDQISSYSTYGSKRDPATWDWKTVPTLTGLITNRGFTGHVQLDELGLIHMKGRIYDPNMGRFISPDPFIQAPYNSQSLNRYSYCMNNPLVYIDPMGFLWGISAPSGFRVNGSSSGISTGSGSSSGTASAPSTEKNSSSSKDSKSHSCGQDFFGIHIGAPHRSTMASAGLPGGLSDSAYEAQKRNFDSCNKQRGVSNPGDKEIGDTKVTNSKNIQNDETYLNGNMQFEIDTRTPDEFYSEIEPISWEETRCFLETLGIIGDGVDQAEKAKAADKCIDEYKNAKWKCDMALRAYDACPNYREKGMQKEYNDCISTAQRWQEECIEGMSGLRRSKNVGKVSNPF